MGYVNDVDQDIQKQFAALIFKVKPDTYVLVFRGTDDSIVGWKEDFHMTYMAQIPAQKMAARYLQKALENLPGNFILTGHSKEETWLPMQPVRWKRRFKTVLKPSTVMILPVSITLSPKAMAIRP